MSICFTICSLASLMLYYLNIASLHDGTARIVSISHASLCMRLIFLNSYLHFVFWPSTSFLRSYGHFFWSSYVHFPFGSSLSLAFLFSISLGHGTYKHKPS